MIRCDSTNLFENLKQQMIEYSQDVISGEIVSCQKHKWSCMRFLRDVSREGSEEFPYLFDEDRARRFLIWMHMFKHRKGVLHGQHIEPADIQKFIFTNIYGWYNMKTGYRRFRKAYWQVGRKNAKSQSLSCVGSYEDMAYSSDTNEVYCAATKTEQAKIVWNEAKAMLDGCPDLKGKYKVAYGRIEHIKSGSFMRALSREDQKTGDGLNPQCGIIDEYHSHPTSEIYDILDSGMVARPEPLLIIITTAGFDLAHPCYTTEYQKVVEPLLNPNNPLEIESYFAMVNELDTNDDIKDECVWAKANPILCSYPEGIQSIRERLKLALEAPEKMRDLLTKTMNIWVQMRANGFMDMARWAACGASDKNKWPKIKGLPVIAGIDLSSTIDLTSVSFEIKLPDNRVAVMSHSFMPEDKFQEHLRTDKVDYYSWRKTGWLETTIGSRIDYNYVLDYIVKIYKEHSWKPGKVCFDPALAYWLEVELQKRKFIPINVRQGRFTLSEPTKDFRSLVYDGKIIHQNDPLLTWCWSNCVVQEDNNANIMLDKGKSRERIDPCAALMDAHTEFIKELNSPMKTLRAPFFMDI